jgi:hypothetical protein
VLQKKRDEKKQVTPKKDQQIMSNSPQKEMFDKLNDRHDMYSGELAKFKKEFSTILES